MARPTVTSDDARRAVAAELIRAAEDGARRIVGGMVGPPGVGKSTFATAVVAAIDALAPGAAAYLPMDGFHLANAQLDRLGRRRRKGAPDTFDVAGYRSILARVREPAAADVYVPDFDRSRDDPVAAALVVPAAARVVVTEGNYLALPTDGWAGTRDLIDRLYYLDADPALRRRRLIARHVAGGRAEADAADWVDSVDEPNARLIAATRTRCDAVLVIADHAE